MNIKNINDITVRDLPRFHQLLSNNRQHNKKVYNREVCAFDIETTVIDEIQQSIMYLWQFAIEDVVIIGRTWEEFKRLVKLLKAITNGNTTVIFVHNLSYEIQFMSGVFKFDNESIFPTEARHVLRANIDNLEFRCSYRLTNLDLKSFLKRYQVQHQKIEDFDYTEKRYPWTELNQHDLQYGVNDVIGLVEAIHALMDLNNDDYYTLPLTSTGYVRRECKKAMRAEHLNIMECFPSYDVFKMLRAEFRGGNTHSNRYFVDEVIKEPVTSFDISSSYPSQQCNKLFPASPFKHVPRPSIKLIERLIEHNKAVLFEIHVTGVKLRNRFTAIPYIPIAKCSYIKGEVNDNGRVLQADALTMVINEIDYKIIDSQYCFNTIEVVKAYKSRLDKLPQGLIDCNIEFFRKKTELKGVKGQELYYFKNKELLNSIYGMSVQNPAKASILFNDCLYEEDKSKTEEQLLNEARKRAFTCYQFGCWTTAHARAALQAGIDLCGDSLLYVDTDSCKFIGTADFTRYNEEQKQLSTNSGLYATDKSGITHFGGVYEFDGVYDSFITQGAKKYAYTDNSGVHVTVSGVGKKRGAAALLNAGGLDAFRSGFIFHNCGKTRSIYNDENYGEYMIDNHILNITRNVVIEEQDYTLSRTATFDTVIQTSKADLYKMLQCWQNVHI